MTELFTSKKAKEIAALTAEKEKLTEQVGTLEKQVEEAKASSQDFAALRADLEKEIESMKADWTAKAATLEEQIANLQKEKSEVEAKAAEEIKEIKESLPEKVNEAVAVKAAAMGVPEANLPVIPDEAPSVESIFEEWNKASALDKENIFNKNKSAFLNAAGISEERWNATFNKGK